MIRSAIAVLVCGLLAACASGGARAGMAGSGETHDPNVITTAELANENSPNVYAAIEHLRPDMLRPRLANQSSSIRADRCTTPEPDGRGGTICVQHAGDYVLHVYMDETSLGEVNVMKTIPVGNVKEIRYLNPQQALARFGAGNPGGIILLMSHTP